MVGRMNGYGGEGPSIKMMREAFREADVSVVDRETHVQKAHTAVTPLQQMLRDEVRRSRLPTMPMHRMINNVDRLQRMYTKISTRPNFVDYSITWKNLRRVFDETVIHDNHPYNTRQSKYSSPICATYAASL